MDFASAFSQNAPLLLIGCGKMGGALLAGWQARGLDPAHVWVVDPVCETAAGLGIEPAHISADASELPQALTPKLIVLATKPQVVPDALPGLARFAGPDVIVLSIAAGTGGAAIAEGLGAPTQVIRAMPNTPAAVGSAITAAYAGPDVAADSRALVEAMMAAAGEVVWLADEADLHAVTATSGSGPAYVFHLAECLAAAAEDQGLAPELAKKLAAQTIIGAGRLLEAGGEDAATLRRNVTSPGGTTAAALDVLMTEDGLARLITEAVRAATRRSRELAG